MPFRIKPAAGRIVFPFCWFALALIIECAGAAPNARAEVRCFKRILENHCEDPMMLAVAPDNRVLFIERGGNLRIWNPESNATVLAAHFDVFRNFNGTKNASWEDGLVGIALDPDFRRNHWLYLYYSPRAAQGNRLSRFTLDGDQLDVSSEKVLLEVPVDRTVCCHTAGGLAFDAHGNLFLSTGDNTNPFESDGYNPIDFRPGRSGWDAARSAGNTFDLRGKILRIHPEPDGTYTIPPGNLFPPGVPKTRPEIYVMGCRNPFRISVDPATGTLFWGEVGPDAYVPSPQRGAAGFDEFNRARRAGNFGWPFIIADNKPYRAYDFAAKVPGPFFSPARPLNLSPNNTGRKELPPAQPAWIWYPYAPSVRFPQLGSGGRAACAGPVYHFDEKLRSPHKLPRSLDDHLFLFDWVRNWIVTLPANASGPSLPIQRFAPELSFKRPIDLKIGPDGCLYLIEFGSNWERNNDSQLVRIGRQL